MRIQFVTLLGNSITRCCNSVKEPYMYLLAIMTDLGEPAPCRLVLTYASHARLALRVCSPPVLTVLLISYSPQMCRVDASRYVTHVVYVQTFRNRPVCPLVGKAMG